MIGIRKVRTGITVVTLSLILLVTTFKFDVERS